MVCSQQLRVVVVLCCAVGHSLEQRVRLGRWGSTGTVVTQAVIQEVVQVQVVVVRGVFPLVGLGLAGWLAGTGWLGPWLQ